MYVVLLILIIAIALYIAYITFPRILQFTGGFEWSALENVQSLGSGAFGDVYVVKDGNYHYALKREKIPADWIDLVTLDFKPDHMDEINFYKFIATLSPDQQKHFVRLHNYRIFKCDHVHKLADWQIRMMETNAEFNTRMQLRIQSPYCAEYLMDLGGNSLKSLIELGEIKYNSAEMHNIVAQLLQIIKIIGDNSYIIDDLHSGNIVVKNGLCKLIDYGEVKKLDDMQDENANNTKYLYDLSSLLSIVAGTNEMFQNMPPAADRALEIINHVRFLMKNNAWDNIYKYIKVMNPGAPELSLLLEKPELSVDEIKIIDHSLGPYLATLNIILYPELNAEYWQQIFPDHTLKYDQYIDKESMLFILDNFGNMDTLINYFN
jgi:serine/threonine protein kinase